MYLQIVISRKLENKKTPFFVGNLSATDGRSRIRTGSGIRILKSVVRNHNTGKKGKQLFEVLE